MAHRNPASWTMDSTMPTATRTGGAMPLRQRAGDWRRSASTRVRIFGWFLVLILLALIFGLVLQRSILLAQLDNDVDSQLVQEVAELEQLSEGRDPNTGEPFGRDVREIFTTFLSRNVPGEGEALFTIVEGQPFASTPALVQLLDEPDVLAEWTSVTASTRGELETSEGDVRYIAIPMSFDGEVVGVFVVTVFLRDQLREVNRVLQVGAIVFGSAFFAASLVAWFAAGQVLRPIRQLAQASGAVDDANWRERIPVYGGGEIAELTRNFNEMLDRLENSFATQRRFIDDAGHELRTPITIIRGHLELLGDDPNEREETVRLVTDELDRMARLVEDLLLLAKYETPDFIHPQPIEVEEFTHDIAAKAAAFGERTWHIAEAARVVMIGDRQRLTQAAMNLVRNALEHTPEGTALTLGSSATHQEVRFWVSDAGPGISREEQAHIFDRFSRGRSGKRRTDGAGLGLSIVRVIAEAHGGRIDVVSAPGEGATFALILPLDGPGGNE